jgi:hypothetical protein
LDGPLRDPEARRDLAQPQVVVKPEDDAFSKQPGKLLDGVADVEKVLEAKPLPRGRLVSRVDVFPARKLAAAVAKERSRDRGLGPRHGNRYPPGPAAGIRKPDPARAGKGEDQEPRQAGAVGGSRAQPQTTLDTRVLRRYRRPPCWVVGVSETRRHFSFGLSRSERTSPEHKRGKKSGPACPEGLTKGVVP